MTLRHLEIFVAVCDSVSMTEAARRLHLAQSAVSLAVSELERHYGLRLFDRIGRRLHRTDAGERVLDHARHILESFADMERSVQNLDRQGRIRIGASITIGTELLPALLADFRESWPDIELHVTIDQSTILEQRILRNELDLALIEGLVHDSRIEAHDFGSDELVLVCGSGSRWRATGSGIQAESNPSDPAEAGTVPSAARPLTDFRDEPFILREQGSGTRELFDSIMLTQGIRIEPQWESISTEAIINAVAAGFGLSVLPLRLVARDLAAGRLQQVPVINADFRRRFRLIHHADKYISRSMAAFIRHCLDQTAEPSPSTAPA